MRILKDIGKIFDRTKPPDYKLPAVIESNGDRGLNGAVARKTDDQGFSDYFRPVLQRNGISISYSKLSEDIIKRLPADKIRDLIKDSSPIVAKALSDFAATVAGGYSWTADKTQPDNTDSPAYRLLNGWLERMEMEGNGLSTKNEESARGMFTHGGTLMELVIDEDGRTPLDLKVLSPTTAVFRRKIDPIRGEIYELGQEIPFGINNRLVRPDPRSIASVNFVSLEDDPTVQYRPIQSNPNNPYGTPILNPAVYPVLVAAGFMNSLSIGFKQFVTPNLLLTIDKEKLGGTTDGATEEEYNKLVANIEDQIKKLKPGSFLIYGDEVGIGGTFSSQGRSPLGSISDLQDITNRMVTIAVQSQPILMGSNEAVGETHAIEQRKAYGNLITRSQKPLSSVITYFFNLVLRINNLPPLAEFRLNYQNVAEFQAQALAFQNLHQGLKTQAEGRKAFTEALEQDVEAGYLEPGMAQAIYDERLEMERQFSAIPQSGGNDQ